MLLQLLFIWLFRSEIYQFRQSSSRLLRKQTSSLHVVRITQLRHSCDGMIFNSNKLRDETRRLGVILIAAGFLGGLLEDADIMVVSGLVLTGIIALLTGCLDEEDNK